MPLPLYDRGDDAPLRNRPNAQMPNRRTAERPNRRTAETPNRRTAEAANRRIAEALNKPKFSFKMLSPASYTSMRAIHHSNKPLQRLSDAIHALVDWPRRKMLR